MAQDWCFCVVGNIVKTHVDETGTLRFGSKAHTGGTKVFVYDRGTFCDGRAIVIGRNRYRRLAVDTIPMKLIEKLRVARVFKPSVRKIMWSMNTTDGFEWHGRTADDRREAEAFCAAWNAGEVR